MKEREKRKNKFMIKVTPQINGKTIFSIRYWENWPITWINDKLEREVNRSKQMKEVFFLTLILEKIFLNKTPKILTIMFTNKMENLWSMKGTTDKFTRWVTDWNKMFLAYKMEKRLIFKVQRELVKINMKKIYLLEKWARNTWDNSQMKTTDTQRST